MPRRLNHFIYALLYTALFLLPSFATATTDTKASFAIIYDVETKETLFGKNAHDPMKPSSMTKLMTAYIVFEHLKNGILKLDDTFTVSEDAWRKGGSKMFVGVNTLVKIEDLLRGVIIQSGNDACIVLAEGIAGSEADFATLMNKKAAELGLKDSHFKNATGWPDDGHVMSAHDLAILGARIIEDFPEYYHYYSETEFTYQNITQPNRNLLLKRNENIDGLKTGHTAEAGYGITISGKEEGRRLVVVVNGLESEKARADEAERLFRYGIRYFENQTVFEPDQTVELMEVAYGVDSHVPLITKQPITIVVPKLAKDKVKIEVNYKDETAKKIFAPLSAGTELATLTISIPDQEIKTYPLYSANDVEALGWFGRIKRDVEGIIN